MKPSIKNRKTRREKKKSRKKLILFIVSFIVILGSILYILNSDFLRVHNVRLQGQKTLIDQDIIDVVESYKQERYLGMIPKSNILVMSTGDITRRLQEAFPTIEKISVDIEGNDEVLITIGEREAHSLWCIDQEYEVFFEEECYFADKTGVLYARAPYFSGNVYLKLYIPEPEGEIIGMTISEIISFEAFFDFVTVLEQEYGIRISGVYFKPAGDVELQLARLGNTVYSEPEPIIIFNQSDSFETIARNIGITLNYGTFKRDFGERPEALESIDVRFDGRIFYTFTPVL